MGDIPPQVWGMNLLPRSDFVLVSLPRTKVGRIPQQTMICFGTGIGAVPVTYLDGVQRPDRPTEFGQMEWATRTLQEWKYRNFLIKAKISTDGPVPNEEACNLWNIAQWLLSKVTKRESAAIRQRLAVAQDKAATVYSLAQESGAGTDICREAVELYIRMMGRLAGQYTLAQGGFGGCYIGGGIGLKYGAWRLVQDGFMEEFYAVGHYESKMRRTPVYLVNREVGDLGAAYAAFNLVRQRAA